MELCLAKGILSGERMTLSFPETPDKVWSEMRGLEEFGNSYGPVKRVHVEGTASFLSGYIKAADLNTEAGIQKINQLAEVVDRMDSTEQIIFSGALSINKAQNLDDALRIVEVLDQYEIFPKIQTDTDLGHFLVDTSTVTGKFSFPESTRPYLDYAKIGAEQREALGGVHTPHGLVKRKEETPVQAETPRTMLLTLKASERNYPLVLPASEKQLDYAKRVLGVDEFSQAMIASVEYTAPYLDRLIPTDCITVENANELAHCLQQIKVDNEMKKYCAALEVEEPSSFLEALDLSIDIDDYELIDNERDYAREALRRLGADGELLDTIDGYTDFDGLGRAMMEEDGVRQTEFGLVRRLSKPFPPEQKISQAML